MDIKTNADIIYFIRIKLICLKLYADSKQLTSISFNTIFTESRVEN